MHQVYQSIFSGEHKNICPPTEAQKKNKRKKSSLILNRMTSAEENTPSQWESGPRPDWNALTWPQDSDSRHTYQEYCCFVRGIVLSSLLLCGCAVKVIKGQPVIKPQVYKLWTVNVYSVCSVQTWKRHCLCVFVFYCYRAQQILLQKSMVQFKQLYAQFACGKKRL